MIDIKNIVIFIIIYILPLIVFWKLSLEKNINKLVIFIVSIFYIFLSTYTQNLLPFILVVINISIFKNSYSFKSDYEIYNFSIRNLNIGKSLAYSAMSYFIGFVISIISLTIFLWFSVPVEQQEVVDLMNNLPLSRFVLMMPVTMIFAPVVEEFIFRWFLFEKIFKSRIGVIAGAILSSLIFGIVHFNIKSFPTILWIGIFNCFLIHKKGFWYAVVNHGIFNSVTTFIMLFAKVA